MALRIRKNGKIYCAKYYKSIKNDLYIDDSLHYTLAVILKVIRPINKKGTIWKFWKSKNWL